MVSAILHFDAYLITHPFLVETDHRALVFLNTAKQVNGRLARWAMKLQPFSFTVRYRPGSLNANADALSRLLDEEEEDLPRPLVNLKGGGRCYEIS